MIALSGRVNPVDRRNVAMFVSADTTLKHRVANRALQPLVNIIASCTVTTSSSGLAKILEGALSGAPWPLEGLVIEAGGLDDQGAAFPLPD
jgi:hypothetical protein